MTHRHVRTKNERSEERLPEGLRIVQTGSSAEEEEGGWQVTSSRDMIVEI